MHEGSPWKMKPRNPGDPDRYGARIFAETTPKPGDQVRITTREGDKSWIQRVARVLWSRTNEDDGRKVHGCTLTEGREQEAQVSAEEMWQLGAALTKIGELLMSGNAIEAGERMTKLGRAMTDQYPKPKDREDSHARIRTTRGAGP